MSTQRKRNDAGAVAIVFALSTLLIFALAAIGVDLGNAMNRKKENQNSADLAALAGADALPVAVGDAVAALNARQKVADWLNKNQPSSDGDSCSTSTATITALQLGDGVVANGEVTFPTTDQIKVVAPSTKVNFGMANAIGFNNICVRGNATAAIKSGGGGFAPYYATAPCSSGPQVLKSDAGGLSIPFTVPTLSHDAESNTSVLNTIAPNPNPDSIPLAVVGAPDGPAIAVGGTNMAATNIDRVGFFNSDRSEPVVAIPLLAPAQTATSVAVNVPNAVASSADVWWVRVHNSVSNLWSARAQARPLLVGDAVLSCDPESASGNFGAIDFPWTSNANNNIEQSIKNGAPPPMKLKKYPGPPFPTQNQCQNGLPGVISTTSLRKPDTNCVESTTGLRAPPAYDGYLANPDGKLRVDTSSLCQSQGRPARQTLSTGESVNADLLTCFLKNDTLKLSNAINFAGGNSPFVSELWKSPRFVMVPIIQTDPTGTKWMPIVGFVPGFICDEVTGASRTNPLETGQTENGLVTKNPNKLQAIRIVFFDIAALPAPPEGTTLIDYIGEGPKVITLIN